MNPADASRGRLGTTFDGASDLYQRARPEYPEALIDHLVEVAHVKSGSRLLEVGCATGKATLPLARRGFHITCIEPGPALAAAAAARRNLAGFDAEVVQARFEDWDPAGQLYDLVFAATAWHWVDPTVGYHKAAEALVPEGHLAIWGATHVIPYEGDTFFVDIQPVYDEIGEGLPPGTPLPRPGELKDQRDEIEASGLFEVLDVTQCDWETVYDTGGYLDLLNTFSGHIAMQERRSGAAWGLLVRIFGMLILRPLPALRPAVGRGSETGKPRGR